MRALLQGHTFDEKSMRHLITTMGQYVTLNLQVLSEMRAQMTSSSQHNAQVPVPTPYPAALLTNFIFASFKIYADSGQLFCPLLCWCAGCCINGHVAVCRWLILPTRGVGCCHTRLRNRGSMLVTGMMLAASVMSLFGKQRLSRSTCLAQAASDPAARRCAACLSPTSSPSTSSSFEAAGLAAISANACDNCHAIIECTSDSQSPCL
jgi:hypothetical protein